MSDQRNAGTVCAPIHIIHTPKGSSLSHGRLLGLLLERILELEAQLEAIGAGGVSGQRITKKGEDK